LSHFCPRTPSRYREKEKHCPFRSLDTEDVTVLLCVTCCPLVPWVGWTHPVLKIPCRQRRESSTLSSGITKAHRGLPAAVRFQLCGPIAPWHRASRPSSIWFESTGAQRPGVLGPAPCPWAYSFVLPTPSGEVGAAAASGKMEGLLLTGRKRPMINDAGAPHVLAEHQYGSRVPQYPSPRGED
jgi:hypothetical protein